MPTTFRRHFDDDIGRVESLVALANGRAPVVRSGMRRDDIRLAAVAMAVGAMDAYFCDAYVDCLAKRLQGFKVGRLDLPPGYAKRSLPTGLLVRPPHTLRPNWSLRMAARTVMERENVLDLDKVRELFNPVLPDGKKLWESAMAPLIDRNWKRLTGTTRSAYSALSPTQQANARKAVAASVKRRIGDTIQIRHDWIHNCGRPKNAVRPLTPDQASARIREIRLLVESVDHHIMDHRQV